MVLGCLALGGLSSGSTVPSPSAGAGLFLSPPPPPSLLGGGVCDEVGWAGAGAGTSFKLGCMCACAMYAGRTILIFEYRRS